MLMERTRKQCDKTALRDDFYSSSLLYIEIPCDDVFLFLFVVFNTPTMLDVIVSTERFSSNYGSACLNIR